MKKHIIKAITILSLFLSFTGFSQVSIKSVQDTATSRAATQIKQLDSLRLGAFLRERVRLDTSIANIKRIRASVDSSVANIKRTRASSDTSNAVITRLRIRMDTLFAVDQRQQKSSYRLEAGTNTNSITVLTPVTILTATTVTATTGATLAASGYGYVLFQTSSDFVGTLSGVSLNQSAQYPFQVPNKTLPAFPYVITTGTLRIITLK